MEIKAKVKNLRMSPRKVRLVIDVVRGMKVDEAISQLVFMNKKAAKPIMKLVESGVANALNNYELDKGNLLIKEIRVDEGATLKRWMPRARGRATVIRKRTSHVNLILGEIVDSGEKEAKKEKIEDPIKLDAKAKQEGDAKVEKEEKEEKKETDEKGKKIVDPRGEGHGKNTKIEGKGQKGFVGKMFRRKSG